MRGTLIVLIGAGFALGVVFCIIWLASHFVTEGMP